MPETRTDWVLKAQARGFEQAQRKAGQLSDTAKKALSEQTKGTREQSQSYKIAQREIRSLEKDLQSLARRQIATNNAMAGAEKGTAKYKALKKELKEIGEEAKRTSDQMRLLERAFQKPMAARGSFTQGLLQGAVPGASYLQRGPGMFRQAAGAALGSSGRQIGGGLANAPFGGVGSLQSAAAGIPIMGGLISGQLGRATQLAGRGLNIRRIESQVAASFGLATGGEKREAAIKAAGDRAVAEGAQRAANKEAVEKLAREMALKDVAPSFFENQRRSQADTLVRNRSWYRDDARRQLTTGFGGTEEGRRLRAQAMQEASESIRSGPLEMLRGRGTRFGMQDPQVLQLIGQVARAGGGGVGGGRQALRGADTFLAAQRLGIGADVSGAFVGGVQRGGLRGGGDAATRLERSFQKAIARGLTDTEAVQYLQEVAAGINQWRSTGIPLNERGFNAIARGAGAIGPVRSGVVAGQVTRGFQNIAQGGIQSALDLQVLRDVTGFKGGGLGALSGALESLENLDKLDPQQFSKLISTFAERAGSQDTREQALFVRQGLKRLGANVSLTEANILAADATGGGLTGAQRRQARRVRRRVQTGEGTLQERAAATVGVAERRQTDIENQQTRTGESLITATQNLEESTTKTTGALTDALSSSFTDLTDRVKKAAETFESFVNAMRTVAGDMD